MGDRRRYAPIRAASGRRHWSECDLALLCEVARLLRDGAPAGRLCSTLPSQRMDLIRLASPAWPFRGYVRLYAHRKVRVGGTAVVHPVPAGAFPILEFVFRDRFRVLAADQSPIQMSPRAVVVGLQTHCRSQLQFQGEVECFVIVFQPTTTVPSRRS
jgi:hypothetical protein